MDLGILNVGLIAAVLALIALGSWIKGLTGMGLPVFAVPAVATLTSVEEAVVLMILPGLGANLWLIVSHRRFGETINRHKPFMIAGLLGGVAGTLLLDKIDDRWLKSLLAAWLAVYLLQRLFVKGARLQFQPTGAVAGVIGAIAGTTQGAVGISSQIVAPYFNNRVLEPGAYAFLMATAFLVFSIGQLIAAAAGGLFTADRVAIGTAALIPVAIFTQLGIRYSSRVSRDAFQKILLGVFFLMELKLLWDVL